MAKGRKTSGNLDQRVIIQNASVNNDAGAIDNTYVDLETVWAEVISQRGSEAFKAARAQAKELIRVRIRYRDDITVKQRAIWMGQNYNILHVDRSQRRDGYLWFTAELKDAV